MKIYRTSIVLGLAIITSQLRLAAAQTATKWATIGGTDSFGADVFPEGFDGKVDPQNAEQECKTWCLSVPTCTMFLYRFDGSGTCFVKTGGPQTVEYQPFEPGVKRYNLVMRNVDCTAAMSYIAPYIPAGNIPPVCIESTGNTDDEQDEVPRGALNEPCLEDGTCLNGNLCDPLPDSLDVCKSPMGGNCLQLSDCSNTIIEDTLQCTLEGGTNENRICALVEPTADPPAPSQAAAARRKRNAVNARWLKRMKEECPGNTMACPISAGNSFECVNVNEELVHCGECHNDCQKLPGVHQMGVTCAQGECLIYRCWKGFKLVGDTCVPKLSKRL